MENFFSKLKFSSKSCFGILILEMMELTYLAKFVMIHEVNRTDGKNQAVSDFDSERGKFQKASLFFRDPIVKDVKNMAKKLLVRPEKRVALVEGNIDLYQIIGHHAETCWYLKKIEDTKEGDGTPERKNQSGGSHVGVFIEYSMSEKEVLVEGVIEVK